MKIIIHTTLYLGIILTLLSCNLEKEVEIEIPGFENGYVVESYIKPGRDFGILVTKSYGFFEVFDVSNSSNDLLNEFLVQGVEGHIEVNGQRIVLRNHLKISLDSSKIYNYIPDDKVFFNEGDQVELYLRFPDGEETRAQTYIPERRPVDSVRISIDESQDFDARETTFVNSDSTTTEYFRRQLFRIHDGHIKKLQDFTFDNSLARGGNLAFGSGYEFNVGDTLISRITHIPEEYSDFYQSVTGSTSANSNPFGQPGHIQSNLKGSSRVIGIFTGMNPSEILIKIE